MAARLGSLRFYVPIMLATIVAGLFSRSELASLPNYFGDALWAMLVFWIACVIRPGWSHWHRALAAIAFSFAVELSQLYQAPWINAIRRTWLGGIALGFGFRYSDLVAYVAGVLCGAFADRLFRRPSSNPPTHSRR